MTIVDLNGNPFQEKMSGFSNASGGFANQLQNWVVNSQSADAAILPDFDSGNARAADLVRNDGYAKNGVQLHVDHIVGHQFKLVYKPNYLLLGLDIDNEEVSKFIKMVEAKFYNFAEDSRCYVDAERKRTFTMMIREAVATHCKAGEVTAKGEWFKKRGSPYRTAIKMVDYARICNPEMEMDDKDLRKGVKIDKRGAALGYWVRTMHPNSGVGLYGDESKWDYIPRELPWGRQQFIHLFEPLGEGQTRGANNFLASMGKLKMLEKFQGTTLQNAIINAMYAATIESELDSAEVFKAIGGGAENSMLDNYMNTKAQYYEASNITLENGAQIPHLLPNEKLTLQNVNAPNASLTEFESGILRNIAKGLGVSFEQLSGDFSKTNYSSARAAMSESYRYFIGQREVIAKRFASSIFELWLEEAINIGEIILPNGVPNFYEAKSAWTRCNWIGAGKTQIDGLKGIKEAVEKITAGLSTYEKELGNMGEDYQEIFDQQLREQKELNARGRKAIWEVEPNEAKAETNENPESNTNE